MSKADEAEFWLGQFAAKDMHPIGEPVGVLPRNIPRHEPNAEHWLPIPPSTNNLYFNRGNKRYKTQKYKDWTANAVGILRGWKWKGAYPVFVTITIREKVNEQRDGDNFFKASIDSLVKAKVIKKDNLQHIVDFLLRYRPGTGRGILIELRKRVKEISFIEVGS